MRQSTRNLWLAACVWGLPSASKAFDWSPRYVGEFRAGAVAMRPIENYALPDGVTRWSPGLGVGFKMHVGPILALDVDYAFIYRTFKAASAGTASISPTHFVTANMPVRLAWSPRDYVAPMVGVSYENFSSTAQVSNSNSSEWLLNQFRVHSGVQVKTHVLGVSFLLEGALAMISIANFERAKKEFGAFTSSYWLVQTDFSVFKVDEVESYLALRYGNSFRTHMRNNLRASSREESVFLISGTTY